MRRYGDHWEPKGDRSMAIRSDRSGAGRGGREVLIEMHPIGNSVKVCAIDTVTGVEVSIIGDPRYGKVMLERNVLRKLEYVLKKKAAEGQKKDIIV